ncbi:MAG: MEDS domain-containing protein [Acidobacteriaceae bacterium]
MNKAVSPLSLAGCPLGDPRHVCAFFNDDDEQYRVLLPFIRDGFACGDKAVHVVNPHQHDDHLLRLATAGIDVEAARSSGQFELRTNQDTYLIDGRFDQDRMLGAFEQMVSENVRAGFPLSRIICHMEWGGEGSPYLDDLIEFESRVNEVWQRHNDAVICTYNLEKFGAAAVVDIMRTHPFVIIGGTLQQNPFFVPPSEFLREVRARRAERAMQPVPAA